MATRKRQTREEALKERRKKQEITMNVSIGTIYDNRPKLHKLCLNKSVDLLKTLEMDEGDEKQVAFWTDEIPELIGISTFRKDMNGQMSYTFDYSRATI